MKIKIFKSKDLKYLQLDINEFIKDKIVTNVDTCMDNLGNHVITLVYKNIGDKDDE